MLVGDGGVRGRVLAAAGAAADWGSGPCVGWIVAAVTCGAASEQKMKVRFACVKKMPS